MCAEALDGSELWFNANRLTLNKDKSNTVLFSLSRSVAPNSAKLLGFVLDTRMCWVPHFKSTMKRISGSIYGLRFMSSKLNSDALRTVYFGTCHSLLCYGVLLWGHSSMMVEMFRLQRRALRVVAGLRYQQDCRRYFVAMRVLTLPSVYILESLLYVYNNLETFSNSCSGHGYATRGATRLDVPFSRLTGTRYFKNYFGPQLYNKLPVNVKSLSAS